MPVQEPKPSNADPFLPVQPVIPGVPVRASHAQRQTATSGTAITTPKSSEFSAPLWPVYLFVATVVLFTIVLRVSVELLVTTAGRSRTLRAGMAGRTCPAAAAGTRTCSKSISAGAPI